MYNKFFGRHMYVVGDRSPISPDAENANGIIIRLIEATT